ISGEVVSAASAKQVDGKFFLISGTEVYKTNDAGENYILDYTEPDTLKFINVDVIKVEENYWITGFAVGNNGSIVKYKELYLVTDTEPVRNIIPELYSLKQNYPNPFNPATSIEYSLPVAAEIELVVYNIIGQQVASLVNEQRSAGSYSVVWNADDSKGIKLSSGIYFYKLKASGVDGIEFQEIKKMVLLK
ncbi:MAG TPA: FlgD immunoglobulin-like domain containing protein, partial [Ignavibacteriaceae bacterium]